MAVSKKISPSSPPSSALKLHALVVAAHPDDAEISLGGTILRMIDAGHAVGIVDLTRGELGSRGTIEDRARETAAADALAGIEVRENLGLPDGRVTDTPEAREALAALFRHYRPEFVLAHHFEDLHPDHAACGHLARAAWYLSGLKRLAANQGGPAAHRPRRLYHFMGHLPFEPSLVVDVDEVWERKEGLIRCYGTQIVPDGPEDDGSHFLFGADILRRAESKARYWGEKIGCRYGEPLFHVGPLPAEDPGLV